MDRDDPFASIMDVCKRRHCREARRRDVPLILPPATASSSGVAPLYGSIPAHSIVKYLCVTPNAPKNTPLVSPPVCVESFEDSPPSPPFLLEGSDAQGVAADDDGGYCADDGNIVKLRSMATQEFSDVHLSSLAKFRDSVSSSKNENSGSSPNSKGNKGSASVSGNHPSKKPGYSENKVGLASFRYNTRSKSAGANTFDEVVSSGFPSMKKCSVRSSKLKKKASRTRFRRFSITHKC